MKTRLQHSLVLAVALFVGSTSCIEPEPQQHGSSRPSTVARPTMILRGAGATLPSPAYARWGLSYFAHSGVRIEYEQLSSEQGLAAIQSGRVDFGASDIPIEPAVLAAAGLVQFPVLISAVVPVYNIGSTPAEPLKLELATLADIYLGSVRRWDDAALKRLNPTLALPAAEIIPVFRADTSGTTWIASKALSQASARWLNSNGISTRISLGDGVGAMGNAQAARFVERFEYTIAYVDLAHALSSRLNCASLVNTSGAHVVVANAATVARTAQHARVRGSNDLRLVFDIANDGEAWPIVGASYVLMRQRPNDPKRALQVLRFFDWALRHGREDTQTLAYAPVPPELVELIEEAWARMLTRPDGTTLWRATTEAASQPAPSVEDNAAAQSQPTREDGGRAQGS